MCYFNICQWWKKNLIRKKKSIIWKIFIWCKSNSNEKSSTINIWKLLFSYFNHDKILRSNIKHNFDQKMYIFFFMNQIFSKRLIRIINVIFVVFIETNYKMFVKILFFSFINEINISNWRNDKNCTCDAIEHVA